MSVKCKYSNKFYPLVKSKLAEGLIEFESFLNENFEDASEVYTMFAAGIVNDSSSNIFEPIEQYDSKNGIKLDDKTSQINSFYIGSTIQREQMLSLFKTKLIECSVYNRTTNEFIEPDADFNGITTLNTLIFNYKISLLNTISNYIKSSIVFNNNDIDESSFTLTDKVNNLLSEYEAFIKSIKYEKDSKFNEVYDAYIIINRFDDLLLELTPFIQVDPKYKHKFDFYVSKYLYKGPNVKHYTGFSNNEHMSANEHTSDLAKILLNYFPEIGRSGNPILGTSISLDGFNAVMSKLIAAIYNEPALIQYIPLLSNNINIDFSMLIDIYIEALSTNQISNDEYKIYLVSKLKSIQKYIYSGNMSPQVQGMFTQMALKTIPAAYIGYEYDPMTQHFGNKELKERPVMTQKYFINNLIHASIYNLSNNKIRFNKVLEKYNIEFSDNSITLSKDNEQLTIDYVYDTNSKKPRYTFTTSGSFSKVQFDELIQDILVYDVPENLNSVIKTMFGNNDKTEQSLLLPLIGYSLLSINNNNLTNTLADISPVVGQIKELADVLSVVNGSDTLNVIKNAKGNNLPLFQIKSLIYNHHDIIERINEIAENNEEKNIFSSNLIYKNINDSFILSPKIRADVKLNGKIKATSELIESELFRLSIFNDFYQRLESGKIYLQPMCYADKGKHYLIGFDISKTLRKQNFSIKTVIDNFLNKKGTLTDIYDTIFSTRNEQYSTLAYNIINDYNLAFSKDFTSFDEINAFLKSEKLTVVQIQKIFNSHNINFYQEIHAYSPKGATFANINETIYNLFNTYSDPKKAKLRLDRARKQFLNDLLNNDMNLNIYTDSYINSVYKNYPEWVNKKTGEVILYKLKKGDTVSNPDSIIELNPIIEAYFATDNLLSHEYVNLMVGGAYAHPNKNTDRPSLEDYYVFSEASRLGGQNKRNVIMGATVQPFAQNLKNGVAPEIKIAIIDDNKGKVWNMLGEVNYRLDAMDGAGFSSPYQSKAENNSLLDARVGRDKKTIMHDIDPIFGRATLLKWAVFEITNERRRMSNRSKISIENIFKKMHNISLDKNIDINKYYIDYLNTTDNNLYFMDSNTNKYYYIDHIANSENSNEIYRNIHECTNSGVFIGRPIVQTLPMNTIYDLDQIFGGAYVYSYNDSTGLLEPGEQNLDIVENIINEENLKSKFIGYLVNTSAIKVGAGNINPESAFSDESSFNTITMSTKFGGVQMNADHELEHAEVTEMSQMLSALEQRGLTHDMSNKIYSEIAQVIKESLTELNISVETNNKEELYLVLSRALIQSFINGDKDTLGLAQTFVMLANESLKNKNLDYTIPFSASTINGAFVATVTSNLVKKGIRRKYAGIAAVLVPSNDMIQYFNVGGLNRNASELVDLVLEQGITHDYDENGIITRDATTKAMYDFTINGVINPFIKRIEQNDIDIYDTIVVYNNLSKEYDVVIIDSYEKFTEVKHNFKDNVSYFNWTSRPKNLKPSDTKFDVEIINTDGSTVIKKFSIYDIDAVRLSHIISSMKSFDINNLSDLGKLLLSRVLPSNVITDKKKLLIKLNHIIQYHLNNLADGKAIPNNLAFGIDLAVPAVKPYNVKVIPAQIVMGKLHGHRLGLGKDDTIAKIKSQGHSFFYDKLNKDFKNNNNSDKDSYDLILFNGKGEEIYVKIGTTSEIPLLLKDKKISESLNFQNIEGKVYFNGEEFSSADEKQFYNIIDSNNKKHNLVVVNSIDRLKEILNSSKYNTYRYNYTDKNKNILFNYQFKYNIENNVPLLLTVLNPQGEVTSIKYDMANTAINNIDSHSLNLNDSFNFKDRLIQLSKNRYEAFEKSLLSVGARIPTQSMQSFMSMETILFTDSDVNEVYVPKAQTWLQGSDYDIDKLYIMTYSINDNGEFNTVSKLGKTYPETEVQKLPLPNGIIYKNGPDGYFVTKQDVDNVLNDKKLDSFVNILNGNSEFVLFDESISTGSKKRYLKELNKHSTTKLNSSQKDEGLKNKVVDRIFEVILNPKNQINLHVPINMDDAQEAAKNSSLGKDEKTRMADNPGSKFIAQFQNMVGKEVISIAATSLKSFFLLSNYYNSSYDNIRKLLINGKFNEADSLLKSLLFPNPLTGDNEWILANINLSPLLDYIKTVQTNDINEIELHSVLEMISRKTNSIGDASLILSGLLSAATDNAKELILAKIKATPKYAGIYTYLISVGIPFNKIAEMMTSEIFNHIDNLTKVNIFDQGSYNFSLKSALKFYIADIDILPSVTEDMWKHVKELANLSTIELNPFNNPDWKKDLNTIKELLIEGLQRVNVYKSSGNSDDFDDFDFVEESMVDSQLDDAAIEAQLEFDSEFGTTFKKASRNFVKNPLVKAEYINLIGLTKYIENRNIVLTTLPNIQIQLSLLRKLLLNILPGVEEMKIFGKMAAINQGIATNAFDQYNYIRSIEIFIISKLAKFDEFADFSLLKFLSDETYRQKNIEAYEQVKTSTNILKAITTVPHFNEMFKMLYLNTEIINRLSIKNKLQTELADKIITKSNIKLDKKAYSLLSNYANDLLIINWSKTLDKTINVPIGQNYFINSNGDQAINTLPNFSRKLNTTEGLATFKMLMDTYFIPALKEDNTFKSNHFIKILTQGVVDNKQGNIISFWKLPIDMMEIDASEKTKLQYEQVLLAFNELNGKTFNGWNLVDMFYLYNLLTYKDSFSKRAMTRLFEDLLQINSDNLLVKNYYNYISRLDYDSDLSKIDYDIKDLQYHLKDEPNSDVKYGYEANNVMLLNQSYFTLNMPYLSNKVYKKVVEEITPIKPEFEEVYEKQIDSRDIILDLVEKLRLKYNAKINIITDYDLLSFNDEGVNNAKAFIHNGEMFINIDKADITTPIHELSHLILAGLKEKNPELYYNILGKISTYPRYQEIAENSFYANKHGSDLNEEVFVVALEDYLSNKYVDWQGFDLVTELSDSGTELVRELLDINEAVESLNLMNSSLTDVLKWFGSNLVTGTFSNVLNINSVRTSQKVATIKNELVNNKLLKSEC